MNWPITDGVFELGDLPVERGGVIRDAKLVWQAHGTLNAKRDNVIVYPTSYTATHSDQSWLIGPEGILDPAEWFIVIPDMFSNGVSSSAADTPDFPSVVTMKDNVLAQQRLMHDRFGVDEIAAVYGFSMGAGQAYHWAALFPDLVARAFVVCGSARTATHNKVFLHGLLRIMEAAPEHLGDGRFAEEPTAALRAVGAVYAGWGLSQDFYRADLFRTAFGAPDLDTFLRTDWEDAFSSLKAANLYAQAQTWYHADISGGGDLAATLASIRARVLLMPGDTDLYFRVADNAAELPHLANGELRPIPSVWGHQAGAPAINKEDFRFMQDAVREWLATPA